MFFKNSKEIKQRCFWLVYWSHGGFSNHVGSCFSVYVVFVYPYWGTLLIRVRFSRSPLSLFLSCYLGRWDRFHTCRRPADYLGQVKEVNIHLHQPPGDICFLCYVKNCDLKRRGVLLSVLVSERRKNRKGYKNKQIGANVSELCMFWWILCQCLAAIEELYH